MSTITVSSAPSKNVSGTVSGSGIPVISATTSFRLARCCTLIVVKTSMPAPRISSTSLQRFGWREPGGLACARSSIRTTCGRRRSTASRSSSPWPADPARSRSAAARASSGLPCMSSTPITTSRPASRMRRAAASIASVLPAPGNAPKKILSLPRRAAETAIHYYAVMEDALLLARAQFGLNIGFHILFPTLTIGLAWFLLAFRLKYQRTRDPAWLSTYRLWVKIFALSFAMGVVSGVVMSFQFGTNWPGYMNTVGAIAGPLLAYEILTAFFLEATFPGVMLFGMNRVPDWVHIASTFLVALGTTVSAFWILALNSWMHTPTGHVFQDGQWIAQDWVTVIFNPSFPY